MRRPLATIVLLSGIFQNHDDKRYDITSRRCLNLMAVSIAIPRARAKNDHSREYLPLEQDGMEPFPPEECGQVPIIGWVHTFLMEYIRSRHLD
jgi:hypothetical protein